MLPFVDHPAGDVDRPGALGPAGQELAADRVAHVVGEQGQAIDPEVGHEGGRDVGLEGHRVVAVGLGGEAVAEHVEEEDAAVPAQRPSSTAA